MPVGKSLFLFALGLVLAYVVGRRSSGAIPPVRFVELRPGLYRHNYPFPFLPSPFVPVQTAAFLVKIGDKGWVLVDTGPATPAWQTSFRSALEKAVGAERLLGVVMTHAHTDHSDGLAWVLSTYPEAKLVAHKEERPWTTGSAKYSDLTGDHWKFEAGKHLQLINSSHDAAREISLPGEQGDIGSYVSAVPKGVLEYLHLPGHSPGHIALVHKPSNSILSGDTVMHITGAWPLAETSPALSDPVHVATPDQATMRASQKKLATLQGVDVFYPSHDNAEGFTPKALKAFAANVKA